MANMIKLPLWLHFTITILGIFAGVIGALVFLVFFHNYHAGKKMSTKIKEM